MPLWGNVDTQAAKPKLPEERLQEYAGIVVATTQTSNNQFLLLGASGQFANSQGFLLPGQSVSGNNIPVGTTVSAYNASTSNLTLSAVTTANVVAGDVISIGANISYNSNVANTYNADTILVTSTRLANAVVNVSHTHTGWSHIVKKTNSDGTIRYLNEVLVVTANAVASNSASGNTSVGRIFSGV